MLPAKLLLVACLVAIALSLAVEQSETGKKPARRLTHHSTHGKHTSTENVEHESPPLDGISHDSLHLRKEPWKMPPMGSQQHETTSSSASLVTVSAEVTHPVTHNETVPLVTSEQPGLDNDKLETVTLSSAQQSTKSATASPITQLDIPRQEEVIHPFTHHPTDPTDSFKKTDLDIPSQANNEHQSLQHKNMPRNDSPVSKEAIPRQEHAKHHLMHHKTDLPVNAAQDNVDDKLTLESVNHISENIKEETTTAAQTMDARPPGHETIAHHSAPPEDDPVEASPTIASDISLEETIKDHPMDINEETTTAAQTMDFRPPGHQATAHHSAHPEDAPVEASLKIASDTSPEQTIKDHPTDNHHGTTTARPTMDSRPPAHETTAHHSAHPEDDPVEASSKIASDVSPEETIKDHPTDINEETTTAPQTMDSRPPGHETIAHHSAHPEDDPVEASPKMASDTSPEKTMKAHSADIKQEQTTSSPILRSNITTQGEVHLPAPTEAPTPASQNVTREQTPLDVQLKMSKITSLSASQNIQPKKSIQSVNDKMNESTVVPGGTHPPLEANSPQLNDSAQPPANTKTSDSPKLNSEDLPLFASLTNVSDGNITQDASAAETKRYVVKVKPANSNQVHNRANGNRQRSRPQGDVNERRTMAQARNLNPSDRNTRIIQNRRIMPKLHQRGNEEQSVSDEIKPTQKNTQMQALLERANRRAHKTPTSALGQTPRNNQMKGRVRTIPAQGHMRKNDNRVRNQMLPVPKRNSANNPVKARVNDEQIAGKIKPQNESGHMGTLNRHGDRRTGSNIPGPMPTAGSKTLEGPVSDQTFLTDKTRPTQRNTKTTSSDERGDNKWERTFTGQRQTTGSHRAKGRVNDTEFGADKIKLNQENLKVEISLGRGNRRNDQHPPGRKPTSGNEQVIPRATGQQLMGSEMGNVDTKDMEERHGNKRTNRTSVGPSGNDEITPQVIPLELEAVAPGTRITKPAEVDGRRPSTGLRYKQGSGADYPAEVDGRRPSTGLRYKQGSGADYPAAHDGNARAYVRQVNRRTQSHLRGGHSGEGRDHSRQKRRARAGVEMCCAQPRDNENKGKNRYSAPKECLKIKCTHCFEKEGCSERDVMACNAVRMNFVFEEEKTFEQVFTTVNIYGSIGLCVLAGLLIYVYIYQRGRKDANTFFCTGFIVFSILNIIAILAFVNAPKLFN